MKLLLTSGGLMNRSIVSGLQSLMVKPLSDAKLAFIPTAANVEAGDKWWLIDDFNNCKKAGFKVVDIIDISGVPQNVWQPRLEHADILLFGGGNSFHLMHWLKKSGVKNILPKLLKDRVYVGISAGSMVATKNLTLSNQWKREFTEQIGEDAGDEALGYVDFLMRPHLNSPWFPDMTIENMEKITKDMKETVYLIDDDSAIKVDGNDVSIISEGTWKKFH